MLSPPHESHRVRWAGVWMAWLIAGALIVLHTAVVGDYVRLLDTQGRRGAAEVTTPLRQVIPARHADAQMWVRHAITGVESGVWRVHRTNVDNAPLGREVHWSSGFAWLLRGAAKLESAIGGAQSGPRALEGALFWFNGPLFFATIVLWSTWAARRLGGWAGLLLACALVGHQRFQEAFAPTYVDHHGVVNASILGLVLGAAFMGFGWWQAGKGGDSPPRSARRAALVSAISGTVALWLNAATALPAIAMVGVGGLVAAVW
jgi:hypothetical protein